MCEAGALGSTSPGASTPGLQQLSQVSGLLGGPWPAPGLAQMLGQVLLQPLPLSPSILLETVEACGGLLGTQGPASTREPLDKVLPPSHTSHPASPTRGPGPTLLVHRPGSSLRTGPPLLQPCFSLPTGSLNWRRLWEGREVSLQPPN